MNVLILAGGFGTRLSHIIKDVPKPMAPVGNKPFLEYLVINLKALGFNDIILLTGHMSNIIEEYFGNGDRFGVKIRYSVETSPLGTGGAVRTAVENFKINEDFIVLNGDTYFDVNLKYFLDYHRINKNLITIALKYRNDVKRYGSVRMNQGLVESFIEKSDKLEDGLINGGIYCINPSILKYFPDKTGLVSFENEVMPVLLKNNLIHGVPFGGKFIDIGVPDDYNTADKNLNTWINTPKIKAAFLDRDGTINDDTGYTYKAEDLKFLPGVIDFLKYLQEREYRLIILTNQAGIAKNKFNENDYFKFQECLVNELQKNGIIITGSFFCPYHTEAVNERYRKDSFLRKPNPGMALLAADEYFIEVEKSVMIGNNTSDRLELDYLKTIILDRNGDFSDKIKTYSDFEEIKKEILIWEKLSSEAKHH